MTLFSKPRFPVTATFLAIVLVASIGLSAGGVSAQTGSGANTETVQASDGNATQAQTPAIARAEKERTEKDQTVQTKVRQVFDELKAFENVFVTVKGGVVTLKGRVLEIEDVERAEDLANKIEGVVTVNNLITVETSVEKRIAPALERFQNRLTQVIGFLPIAAVGLLAFAAIGGLGRGELGDGGGCLGSWVLFQSLNRFDAVSNRTRSPTSHSKTNCSRTHC